MSSDFNSSPYVHYVEVDFITGAFSTGNLYRQMWGGFAIAVLKPEKRIGKISISQCQKKMYKSIYWQSLHVVIDKLLFLKPFFKKLKKQQT